jgi:GH35 family endo-1,4-beta-xylanase
MSQRKDAVTAPFNREKDYMEFRISQGIEQNRKDLMKVRVMDQEGRSVTNAHVEIRQLSHQFKFGANLFLLDEMETEEKNRRYREKFPETFNHATLPFYWNGLEPEQGKPRFAKDSSKVYRRPAPDLCLEYCEEKGIRPKAHCLVYDAFTPDWVPDDVPMSKALYRKRLCELGERYQGRIEDWEVINETLIPYHVTRNHPVFLEPNYLEWAFDMAKAYFPTNCLLINEATDLIWGNAFKYNRSEYFMLIDRLLQKGTRIDGIGMQYHMFYPQERELEATRMIYDPRRMYDVMDMYSRFHLPVQITEITIPAYSNLPEDEETQAEIVRNLYRIWFSHEAVESIVWWNLIDGYAYQTKDNRDWNENVYYGGLLRHDLSEKPAYQVIKELVNKEWRTNAALITDCHGVAALRGFFGDYEVSATAEGKTVTQKISLSNHNRTREYTIVL